MDIIYTRTIGVHMNKLDEAMEIAKEQAAIQEEHSGIKVYVSFQFGGNPRTIQWLSIGDMNKMFEADPKFSADPKYVASLKKMECVFVDGSMRDQMRAIINN